VGKEVVMLTIDRTPMMIKFEKETGGSATYFDYNDWLQMEVENKTQAYINWLEKIARSTELKECPSCGAEVIPNPYCHDLEQKIELLEMQLAEIEAENDQLRDQLTWRSVNEKPEEGQFIFGYNKKTKCFDVLFFCNDEFYLRGIAVSITHWLPIPPAPAPEGE
jgi:hypothetical protein